MRVALKWAGRVFVVLFGMALLGLGGAVWVGFASLPDLEGRIALDGIGETVTIERDANGIPTIRAESEADAYFAVGYVHAQDRLWQMVFSRLVAQGRLAEVIGERGLFADRVMRTLDLAGLARAAFAALPRADRDLLGHYAAGINAFLETRHGPLPPEFQILWHDPEPFEAWHSVLFAKLMAYDLAGSWRSDLLRGRLVEKTGPVRFGELYPEGVTDQAISLAFERGSGLRPEPRAHGRPPLNPATAPDEAGDPSGSGLGSNVFALGGARTASGAAILASDPHLRLSVPGFWYLARIETPQFSVEGGTLPSLPFVVIGRNADIAWGMTTAYADTEDLFVERLDPDRPGHYLTEDGPMPFGVRTETLAVRDGDPVTLEVRATRNGPVLSDVSADLASAVPAGHAASLAWTGLDPHDRSVSAGFALARSRDWATFRAALSDFAAPAQNVAFADRQGQVGLQMVGRLPLRAGGNGRLPVPGWTGEGRWVARVPFEQLPNRLEPPSGAVFNANNPIVDDAFPVLIARDWPLGVRGLRLRALLEETREDALSSDDAASIQNDLRSNLATAMMPLLDRVEVEDPAVREALDRLLAWNGLADAARPEPLLFHAWFERFASAVVDDELGDLADAFRSRRDAFFIEAYRDHPHWCDDLATPVPETCEALAGGALARALEGLEARHGRPWHEVSWGEAHEADMRHRPLGELPVLGDLFSVSAVVGGDQSSLAVASPAHGSTVIFPAVHGAGLRLIADMARERGSMVVTATGQSGHPLSRHFRDLTESWLAHKLVPFDAQRDEEAKTLFLERKG